MDAFLFEVIAAKDFFLQEINTAFIRPALNPQDVDDGRLMGCSLLPDNVRNKVVGKIRKLKSQKDSWLWRLNNYRNVATHRHLLRRDFKVEVGGGDGIPRVYLPMDPDDSSKGSLDKQVIPYCEESLKQMAELLEELYSQL